MARYKHLLKKYNDMDSIYSVSEEERRKDLKTLSKIANKNMQDLKRNNKTQWAYSMAETDLTKRGYDKFTYKDNMSLREVNGQLVDVLKFLGSKSHTVSGYKELEREHRKIFTGVGLNVNKKGFDKQAFFDFLGSELWRKDLKKRLDSKQVFSVLYNAIDTGVELDNIIEDFQKYEQSVVTFTDIIDKYGIAESEWLENE